MASRGRGANGPWAFWALVVMGGVLLVALWFSRSSSEIQGRLATAGIGILAAALPVLRPRFFWENGAIEAWREVFGDWSVYIVYLGIGVGFVLYALLGSIE